MKVIVSNILALGKSKEVMLQVIEATRYRNWHIVIKTYNDITYVIKFLVAEKIFKKTLGYGYKNNSKTINIDLF